jgi:hypothetical protein
MAPENKQSSGKYTKSMIHRGQFLKTGIKSCWFSYIDHDICMQFLKAVNRKFVRESAENP